MGKIRLDKYLSQAGMGTRTQVKELLKKGLIQINGAVVKKPELKIDDETDCITCRGEEIKYEKNVWYMLNKPAGYVTATKDRSEKTVMELLPEELQSRKGLFPVGRLDKDTVGLLLFTDDGPMGHYLLSPAHHVDKMYIARLNGKLSTEGKEALENGVDIGDDTLTMPAVLEIADEAEQQSIRITICEGRFHQIKRMFHAVGREVLHLKRVSMGHIVLDETLAEGEGRRLTAEEVISLTVK